MLKKNDETFTFGRNTYDIELAQEFVNDFKDTEKIDDLYLPLEKISGLMYFIRIDKEYAMSSKNTKPGIAVLTKDGLLPIDGWHRAYKKCQQKCPYMRFFIIQDLELVEKLLC